MCSLPNLHGDPPITKVCFHAVRVVHTAPADGSKGRKVKFWTKHRHGRFSYECWRFCHAFPLSKTEWEKTWMTHWHYCSRFLLYLWELVVFSCVSLLDPVIHEWTRQPEPAIVEVHWEQWILRINFFRVRVLFPSPIKSISRLCSLSAMTFPFLSLIVWRTIICPLPDEWAEYNDGATLWYTVVYIIVRLWWWFRHRKSNSSMCFKVHREHRGWYREPQQREQWVCSPAAIKGSTSEWNM